MSRISYSVHYYYLSPDPVTQTVICEWVLLWVFPKQAVFPVTVRTCVIKQQWGWAVFWCDCDSQIYRQFERYV